MCSDKKSSSSSFLDLSNVEDSRSRRLLTSVSLYITLLAFRSESNNETS
jgi:hypothetical protein